MRRVGFKNRGKQLRSTSPRRDKRKSPKTVSPARGASIRKRSAKQSARERDQFGPHANHIRSLPCEMCEKPPRSSAHHTVHRKHGGLAKHLVPLCGSGTTGCHGVIHGAWGADSTHKLTMANAQARIRTMQRLKRRAEHYWKTSPVRHLYCATCDRYKGKKPCPKCIPLSEDR